MNATPKRSKKEKGVHIYVSLLIQLLKGTEIKKYI